MINTIIFKLMNSPNRMSICLFFISLTVSSLTGYSQLLLPLGVNITLKASYRSIKVKTPATGLTIFEKEGFQFEIPAGWSVISYDSTDYKGFYHDNMVSLYDGKDNRAWFWRDQILSLNPDMQPMEDDLSGYAPLNQHVKSITIYTEGADVQIYVWKAYHICNGKKKEFTIIAGYKESPVFKPLEGLIRFFSRSPSPDSSGKMEADIIKMAEHLQIYEKPEKNREKRSAGESDIEEVLANIDIDKIVSDVIHNLKGQDNAPLEWTMDMPEVQETAVSWNVRTPATNLNRVVDARMITSRHLYLSYNSGLSAMIDTHTKEMLWYHDRPDEAGFDIAAGDDLRMIIYKSGSTFPDTVKALETSTGKVQWSTVLEEGEIQGWLPLYTKDILVAVQQEKLKFSLTALDMKTGTKKWEVNRTSNAGFDSPPFPALMGDQLVIFYDGIEVISSDKGLVIWKNSGIQLDNNCPIPKTLPDTILVLDPSNTLYWLNAKTGNPIQTFKGRAPAKYTNLYPMRERVYLRGMTNKKDGPVDFFIDAISNSSGEKLWSYSDSVPVVSNFIDNGRTVYAATWKGPLALDRNTGKLIFNAEVSEVGKSFPATIRNYGDTIVFTGEMVIAGINASTGRVLFRHAFSPVNQLVNLDALDFEYMRCSEYLRHFGPLARKGITLESGTWVYFLNQSRKSQEQSDLLARKSHELYDKYRSELHDKYRSIGWEDNFYKSQVAHLQSSINQSFARAELAMSMALLSSENMTAEAARLTAQARERIHRAAENRRWLEALYQKQLEGEFAVRVMQQGNGCTFIIIHLPTGSMVHMQTIPKERGLLEEQLAQKIILDPDQNVCYYHELRMLPELEKSTGSTNGGNVAHAVYLVAVPINLTK